MSAYLITRAVVRFAALTAGVAAAYVLLHLLATAPLLVMGL
jgi:hypothetical protein